MVSPVAFAIPPVAVTSVWPESEANGGPPHLIVLLLFTGSSNGQPTAFPRLTPAGSTDILCVVSKTEANQPPLLFPIERLFILAVSYIFLFNFNMRCRVF